MSTSLSRPPADFSPAAVGAVVRLRRPGADLLPTGWQDADLRIADVVREAGR